ncbi:MAG: TIGR03013 family PEP-CTERM/XrtA system glycosyltransferase [Deltaproteobacteria bacterium]|nr:TIGR03013 family PEP-CTERM/XrtA system glycosyltransferase [Deltaproteobacteria bacterium]
MYFFFNRYFPIKQLYLWISELIIIFMALIALGHIISFVVGSAILHYDPFVIKIILMVVVYMVSLYYFDIYSPELYRPSQQMLVKLAQALGVATLVLMGIYYVSPQISVWKGMLIVNALVLPLLITSWRSLFTHVTHFQMPREKVLLIGTGDLAQKIGSKIYTEPHHGLHLAGFIDDNPHQADQGNVNPGIVGGYGDIARVVREKEVRRIIVALADRRAKLPMSALLDCKLKGVTIEEGETFNERLEGKVPLDQLKPSWMVFSDGFKSLRSRKILKRILDIFLSALLLIPAAPLLLITPLLIKLESKGPAIFKQKRVGENGREFDIYKFRSMRTDAEDSTGPVWAREKDNRITKIGAFIRKVRIDELPQIFNVIKGDMSFVGPRPERQFFVDQLKREIPYFEMRTVVKPGLTGWTQVKYPYGATIDDAREKLQYDIYYIKNMSPVLDFIIFFMTIKVVLFGKGAR